ncbi:hypothetical protein O0L34_g615 [Tuta absoluta]|nr:hypothetical protein O0L34_g615 [Tuta absoluta]
MSGVGVTRHAPMVAAVQGTGGPAVGTSAARMRRAGVAAPPHSRASAGCGFSSSRTMRPHEEASYLPDERRGRDETRAHGGGGPGHGRAGGGHERGAHAQGGRGRAAPQPRERRVRLQLQPHHAPP